MRPSLPHAATHLGEQDCILLATTLGTVRQVACDGGDAGFVEAYSDTVNLAANGNCANITSIRDQDDLTACVACLLDASCYDAAAFCANPGAATLPGACVEQLQLLTQLGGHRPGAGAWTTATIASTRRS